MYRIESYVTSIILSYVDRYIKNFKRQDAQVSLWEGDGSLHNLDLDLEVLDQELNLPFSFVSGHIHELLIHVPWTRIASEPVKITINTIECIMKLKPPGQGSVKKEKKKRSQSTGEENVTPPSYMSSLVNKIICNLSVTCNNLILKYVEEDIVLSMNIKTLSLNTVNSNWLPEFSEITAAHLILRNIISLTDVTICLDKRNASGRIEFYLEPLLYKCSLVVRLSRSFQNISTMSAISTRVAIYCDNVTLSISKPQVPMLLRLAMLTKITMNQPKSSSGSSLLSYETSSDSHSGENEEKYESWTTWMWGFVPYILPTAADGTVFDIEEELKTMHLGSYIKDFTLDLKLVEDGRSWESFMKIKLEGCFMEMTSNTNDWMNIQLGISLATVQPLPQYDIENYLTCGQLRPNFIQGTLFDNPDKGLQQRNWQAHMSALTENFLLERSPAIAVDYLSTIEIPVDSWADNFLSEPREKVLVRYVVGPVDVNVTTGLLHRIEVITKSAESYDYPHFSSYTSVLKEDSTYNGNEVKYFMETYIPHHVTQFTISEATVRIFCSYSPLGMASKKSKKGLNAEIVKMFSTKQHPHLLLRLKCLDGTYTKPLTPEKLMGLTLRSHNRELVLDSMTKLSAAALKLSAAVLVGETEVIDLIDLHKLSLSFSYNCLFHAEPDTVSMHCVAQLGELTFNSTYPKLLLGINIVSSLNSKTLVENPLYRSTLVQDSMNIMGIPFLKTSINGVRVMFVQSKVNESLKIRIGNMNGYTYFMGENSKPKVVILSAGSTGSMNVLEVVLQRPLTEGSTTPFLMYIKLRQFHINLEQSLFDWLTYRPRPNVSHTVHRWDSTESAVSRKISSSSLSSLSKKPTEIIEKVIENEPNTSSAIAATSFKDLENKIKWLMKWLEIVVSGDITDLSLSFTSAGTVGSLLFIKIPSISIASSHGKFSIDTDELPVPLVWRKCATSFPWSVDINGVNGYSVKNGGNKEMFLAPFSINCTVAVTSKVIPSMSMAITMHTDTSNISVALCREQICSLAEFLTAIIHVLNVTSGTPVQKKVDHQLDLKFESSDESYSASQSQSMSQAAEPSQDNLKISFWLQWTLAKFSSSLYTTPSKTEPETLKLTLEIEDIILSTDMDINDKVYQKMKIKLGTASVKHYIRQSPEVPWKYGSFGGVTMMGHDSTGNDSEFMALTITRALAVNYHAKINTTSFRTGKENARNKTATADSYLVEVDLKLEPLDFVLPPSILGKFLTVIEPLIWRNDANSTLLLSPAQESPINQLTTADLPLLYLDIQQIRAFVPALLLEKNDNLNHDCIILYLEQIIVGHDNTNPVNRRILRSDLYNSAQRARVTSLPGSHLEDRQYQLEFSFQISTGKWEELAPHVTGGESEGLVNPAVYWNSDQAPSHHKGACLTPLLSPVKVSLSLAPPIVTAGFVVSGLNFEGYLTTEVDISLNLEQLTLLCYLWNEMLLMIPETNEPPIDPIADSGIESVEGSLTIPLQRVSKPILIPKKSSVSLNTVSSSTAINAKGSRQRIQTVPTDLLLIAKSISVKIYSLERGKTKPLFYICVLQPLASIEKQGDTSIRKASLYDLLIKHGNDTFFTNGRIEPEDFSETLIETKEGDRDPYKGIPPALINIKSTTIGTKLPTIDIDVGRPIKITLKVENINFLNNVKEMIFNSLNIHSTQEKFDVNRSVAASHIKLIKSNRPSYVSALIVGTNQIMFDFQSQDINARNVLFSIGAISGQINFTSSTYIRSNFQTKSATITLSGLSNHLVMNPFSFTLNSSLMWESWAKNTPIISCQILSEVLALEFSNYYIESFQQVYEEFLPLLNIGKKQHENNSQSESDLKSTNDESDNEEQLYKDDLQAGAFQFVNIDNQPDIPSAYQVVFPTSTQMSWAYPQPRYITSLTVLPVPFRFSRPEGITIVLQYLDLAGWKTWTDFCLSETKVTDVELPKKLQVASTWRVVMKTLNPPLNVQALAASLRVDSVFSPRLIPRTTFNLDIDCCQITLWAGPTGAIKLYPSLRRFCATDIAFIDEYPFATAYFEQSSLKLKTWKDGEMEAEVGCRPRLDILNCRSLQEQCCIQPFQLHCTFSLDYMESSESNPVLERRITIFAGPMIIYVAPPIGHTITAAVTNSVLLPYIICNDTCFPIRIGQAETNEDITIHCLQCHFYSWRSSGHKMDLRFSVNLADNKYWSVPVSICNPGNVKLVLADENGRNMIIIIVIKKLSHIMTQVLISGELIVYNNLDRGVDVRLVATTITERQRYITVNAGGRAPSIVLSPDAKYNLRLALEGHWSGLVPLYATSNSWLVKIPLQDKKDFLSVWCQIFKDKSEDGRILVVVSPMYLIKSLLPCDANVLIKTEEFQSENSLKVPGRGVTSNLYTSGTTSHHHLLTFHIDGNLPSSLPHVPLSYSAMDGRTPPPPPIPNVDTLIERTELTAGNVWPFLGSQWEGIPLRLANQPDTITHVKVRFCGDKLRVANSLLVELIPWALVINTLGLSIALQSTDKFLCALHHFSILAPPPIEGTFYLLIELNDGFHKSNGLQLSDSQAFYKPHVTGLIPVTSHIQVRVQAPDSVIYSTLHSKMVNGVRILHVSASYIVANLSSYDLSVAPFSVRKDVQKLRIPSEIFSYSVSLPKQTKGEIRGEPLGEWHELGHGPITKRQLYLIFEHDDLVSPPITVPPDIIAGISSSDAEAERDETTLLLPMRDGSTINACLSVVFQICDGTTYITVDDKPSSLITIHNRTAHLLIVARAFTQHGGAAIDEFDDWEWRFMLPGHSCGHYKVPPALPGTPLPSVVVARADYNNSWSTAISLVPSSGSRLVNLPHSQDLSATVVKIGYTTHLILSHANHSLISASDVRSRLSLNATKDLVLTHSKDQENISSENSVPPKNEEIVSCNDMNLLYKEPALYKFSITCFLKGITLMLCTDPPGTFHWQEVAALTLDNVGITIAPVKDLQTGAKEITLRTTVWDLQVDNQEFQQGGYDFSVVVLRQGQLDRSCFIGEDPFILVETARNNDPALDLTLILNCNVNPVLQDVRLNLAPLQLYVEDTYLLKLKDDFTKLFPLGLIEGGFTSAVEELSSSHDLTEPAQKSASKQTEVVSDVKSSRCEQSKLDEEKDDLFNVSDEEEGDDKPVDVTPSWQTDTKKEKSNRRETMEDSENETDQMVWSENPLLMEDDIDLPVYKVGVPQQVITSTYSLSRPLKMRSLHIAPLDVLVSVHTSTKFYIALDQSPLTFSAFDRTDVVTTPFRLGHAITLHYFLGAIYGTGWALGSLQLLGAPAGLARSVGHGLKSFITMPYKGIMEGPTGFLLGVLHGSAALMKHITAGTLTSVTQLAGSWSRTLDRLTLSPEDLKYAEQMRRVKPQGLAQGIKQGLTEFGVSLLGGVGGLAQQPLEYATGRDGSLVGSLGRGIVGVMARPISGAAELVALTAHGILLGAGWADNHIPKHQAICQGVDEGRESRLKYSLKIIINRQEKVVAITEGTTGDYEPLVVIITSANLYIVTASSAEIDGPSIRSIALRDVIAKASQSDPTLINICVITPDDVAEKLSQKRIAEYVRESQLALANGGSTSRTEIPPSPPSTDSDPLRIYVSPQRRDYFLILIDFASRHASDRGFPIFGM